jgi:CRP/FNR family cyclic AMP-dependent transcriptional regulator
MNLLPELLSKNPVFSHLKQTELSALTQQAVLREYPKGEWIAHYGTLWPYLFVVVKGRVTAVKESEEGRSLIIASIEPGEIFWGAAFFQEEVPNLAALVAGEHSRIYLWSRERMLPILLQNGRLSWELSRLLVRRMQRASDIVEELAFQTVTGRLAKFLVTRFGESEVERVSRNLTLEEMAAHIGTTREMVCRTLHRFANLGLIDITRTEFIFMDRDGLAQLAQKLSE